MSWTVAMHANRKLWYAYTCVNNIVQVHTWTRGKKNLWMLKLRDSVSPLGTKGVCVSNSALVRNVPLGQCALSSPPKNTMHSMSVTDGQIWECRCLLQVTVRYEGNTILLNQSNSEPWSYTYQKWRQLLPFLSPRSDRLKQAPESHLTPTCFISVICFTLDLHVQLLSSYCTFAFIVLQTFFNTKWPIQTQSS